MPASELIPNPKNWRTHPQAQQDAIRGALSEIGYASALLARETDAGLMLIDGHLRAETTPDEIVPVLVLDVDEAEADKLLATFDPLSAMADADAGKLDALLKSIETDSPALQAMLDELAAAGEPAAVLPEAGAGGDEFDTTPEAGPTRTNVGELWLIKGNGLEHRLLVGDCTVAANVERLMGGEKAILMSTDPPYGVNFSGAKYNPRAKEWDGIANDKLQGTDLEAFLACMFGAWLPVMDDQAVFYFWTAAMAEGAAAAAAIRAAGLHIQSQIIWNKNCLVLGQADYHWKHENCWYAFWKGNKHRWYGERDKTTVWDVSKLANSSYEHPMQKPVELYAIPMRHHTLEGELVVDPFAGSGSQFVAAHRLNRRCFGCEIEPKYADVILKRCEAEGMAVTLQEVASPKPAASMKTRKRKQ